MNVKSILDNLRLTMTYRGYQQMVSAIMRIEEDEDNLHRLIEGVYKPIALEQGVDWRSVERNLRTLVLCAWQNNQEFLSHMAGYPVTDRPSVGVFLHIVYNYKVRHSETSRIHN